MGNARALAVANENRSIDESVARAEIAKPRRRTALEAVASRLQIQPANLINTLRSTVFRDANDSEFAALIIVCNEYRLNPLLKEIYAFKSKGGGIMPMVSVDGWIRIMNEHPAFDGIEFEYHNDEKGNTEAIEAIIYRKDRAHPVKVIEYMVECAGTSEPWRKVPRRFLRHRALIQGARVAFGLSGIAAEGDEAEYDMQPARVVSLPSSNTAAEFGDEIPTFDRNTGEIHDDRDERGMTQVDEDTARELDAGDRDGDDEEVEQAEERPMWLQAADRTRANVAAAKNIAGLKAVDTEWLKARAGVEGNDADLADEIDGLINARRKALAKEG